MAIQQSADAKAFRDAMGQEVTYMQAHEPQIHYSQSSARDDWARGKPSEHVSLPTYMDCSSYASYLIWRSCNGDPDLDPSGYGWRQVGNSTSIANHAKAHGLAIPMMEARKYDLCVWSGHHVSVLTQAPSRDPKGPLDHLGTTAKASSHGSEGGPYFVSVGAEVSYYKGVMPIFVRTVPIDYKAPK